RRDDSTGEPRGRCACTLAGHSFRARLWRDHLRGLRAGDAICDPATRKCAREIINSWKSKAVEHRRTPTLLAVHDVQRAFFDIERGFFDGFAQGGMRMSSPAEIFRAATKFNHRNGFGD